MAHLSLRHFRPVLRHGSCAAARFGYSCFSLVFVGFPVGLYGNSAVFFRGVISDLSEKGSCAAARIGYYLLLFVFICFSIGAQEIPRYFFVA